MSRTEPMPGSPEPPEQLRTEYAGWRWRVAWQYGPETITWSLASTSGEVRFLKMSSGHPYPSLADERARMVWARGHLPVPTVIQSGSDRDLSWLVTSALPGSDATDPRWAGNPEWLVPILARGLRQFHGVPVEECSFDFRLTAALAHVRRRLAAGHVVPERDFHPEFADLSAEGAVRLLEETKPTSEDLVVCHGDYCPPNIMIDGGVTSGYVDLGELGVADRWWDLAVATWSLTWNLGPGYEGLFFREYGLERDEGRLQFYRLLYDLAS